MATSSSMMLLNPIDDALAKESEELDGYFSDTPLIVQVNYPILNTTTYPTSIIITNLPKVSESKFDRLQQVVTKLVSKVGPLLGNPIPTTSTEEGDETKETEEEDASPPSLFNGMYMPFDKDTDLSCGFCFVQYDSIENATKAVEVLNGYKFDKNHSLVVIKYDRGQKLQSIDTTKFNDDIVAAVVPDDSNKENKTKKASTTTPPYLNINTTSWLEDSSQRDQFIVRYGKETVVSWWDGKSNMMIDYDGSREKEAGVNWCDYYCFWSSHGSYLATLIPSKGVVLWGGTTYEKLGRFPAPGVKIVVFSPNENYLLTNNEDPTDPTAIKVYHIASGKLLRAYPLYPDGVSMNEPPPPFLWSFDDAYLARMGNGLISIYETPGMKLLDQRSLAAEGIHEFQWSPRANIIAYWAPEQKNSPAHVDVIEIPSRLKLRQKNLFNVSRCNMVWQDQGYYLAVKVTRHTKSKKTLYNNIELFRLNETGVPVEMLDTKDAVMALQFEPKGTRFAMIHAENPSAAKVKVSFYDMMKWEEQITQGVVGLSTGKKSYKRISELNLIETLDKKQCNFISWSPAGNVLIMASLGDSASGTLEFYDITTKNLVIKEHYRANQVLWDPSGRTVASIVSQPIEGGNFKFAMDNGYIIWSFQGKNLQQQSYETFYQFVWRPRMEHLLTPSELENVKRNLKKYEKQFDKADKQRQRLLYLEETAGKRYERTKYRDLVHRNIQLRRQKRNEYIQLLNGYDSDDNLNYTNAEIIVETILSKKEEIVM